MAEDRPRAENRVELVGPAPAADRLPPARITHHYGARDLAARAVLVRAARRILRKAGALKTYAHSIRTFSHALGTVRMGDDPAQAPLDGWGAFRGLDNLYVTDASALPRSGGVNPSLTIAQCPPRRAAPLEALWVARFPAPVSPPRHSRPRRGARGAPCASRDGQARPRPLRRRRRLAGYDAALTVPTMSSS
jgi:choline dehydrogenase-like flavoprotein